MLNGIGDHLPRFSVAHQGPGYALRHADADWSAIRAWPLDVPPGYAAALAWVGGG